MNALLARTAPVFCLFCTAAASAAEPQRLDEMVVTSTRTEQRASESPVEVQVINVERIRRSGARDLAELLEREGGVYASRLAGRGSSIEIQGLSSEHVLILVDGRRVNGRINGAIDLSRLRVDAIEQVEIVRGPSSALYGADALGGVVNVITRRGNGDHSGSLTFRADERRNEEIYGHSGWSLGELDGQVSGGWLRTQPYDLDPSTPSTDGIDGRSKFASANADWRVDDRLQLGLSGAYSLDDSQRVDGNGSRAANTSKRIEDVRVGVAPRWEWDADTDLSADVYYSRYFDQFLQQRRNDGEVLLDEETLDELYVAGAQLEQRRGRHRLLTGAELHFERLQADRLGQTGERDRQSLFAQDEWNPLSREGRLLLVPGLRYDRDSQFGDQLSPKLAARYQLSDDWVLRAGYGRGYRPPDFKQLLLRFDNPSVGYRVEGNPALQPERSNGCNIGLVWDATARSSYSLGAYHNRVSDLIEIVQTDAGPPIIFSYRNIASAVISGVDAQARWRLTQQPLDLQLGYGWLHSEDRATGEPLSGRPEHRVNALARYEPADYAVQLRGVWISERRFATEVDSGGPPLAAGSAEPYGLFDLRGEWLRWPQVSLAAGIDNLFDAGNPSYLPIAPRAAYLEMQWHFSL